MTRCTYYTATTLDGFIADEHDSLAWLFEQSTEEGGPAAYDEFIAGIGAMVMGATTYSWILEHMRSTGEPWVYDLPCWVFTHRSLPGTEHDVRVVSGPVEQHRAAITASAGDRGVWVVGGGDLAGQCAEIGFLDRVVVSIAPVTLGSGRPLLPRRLDLELVATGRNGDFVTATYDVRGLRSQEP